jgi:hypothetical protein
MPSFVSALVALAVLTVPAAATAVASVKGAFWQADFAWYDDGVTKHSALPEGVVLTCTGTATSDGATGCWDSVTATAASSDGSWQSLVVDRLGGLLITNSGGTALGGVFGFTARFASFYPATPDSGARVDDGSNETATYFTVVQGAGGFDLHGCNMVSAPGHSGPQACRPVPPEYQDSVFTLSPSPDWSELAADWRIYIEVSALGTAQANDPIPEPPALALLLAGLTVLASRRRVRSLCRQIRRPSWSRELSRPRL